MIAEALRALERAVRADPLDDSLWERLQREKVRRFGLASVFHQGGESIRTVDSLLIAQILRAR